MVITPPYAQMSCEELFSAGLFWTKTCGLPTIHVPVGAGMHGIGVSTPSAAAVAEATVGLARLEHTPKVGTLAMGAESLMVAAEVVASTLVVNEMSEVGAAPKLQVAIAPVAH